MPNPELREVSDDPEIRAAALALCEIIGPRPDRWFVSVRKTTRDGWIVEVDGLWHGESLFWQLVFVGEWRTKEAVARQFALNLTPYPSSQPAFERRPALGSKRRRRALASQPGL